MLVYIGLSIVRFFLHRCLAGQCKTVHSHGIYKYLVLTKRPLNNKMTKLEIHSLRQFHLL